MVIAAALADRVFLEHTETRRRLARVEQLRGRRAQCEDVLTGMGGDTAETLEEVQEDAFGGKQLGGGPFDLGDRGARRDELAVVGERLGMTATAVSREHDIEEAEAGEDNRTAGDDPGAGAFGAGEQSRGRIARA